MTGDQLLRFHLSTLTPLLQKGSIRETYLEVIRKTLDMIPFFTSPIFSMTIEGFQRVTINKRLFKGVNQRIHQTAMLKNPPAELVKRFGRANLPGQSVLYAAFDPITVLNELKPDKGDLITITKWN